MINFLSNALKFCENASQILINIRLNEIIAKKVNKKRSNSCTNKLETK
jgi:hypothetical protein